MLGDKWANFVPLTSHEWDGKTKYILHDARESEAGERICETAPIIVELFNVGDGIGSRDIF